ncbi:MAG: glycine--tRNA ligase subunit beta [Caulobacteraceae bacterium]|nr:glycine--tRNA ligase subunit beta [Caulobacteraceae bacterium]
MAQFLLELFCEEIPARMQEGATADLARLAREGLAQAELAFDEPRAFAGPRRLTLVVDGLPAAQTDRVEERKGPRVGAPEAALAGFLRSTGVARETLIEKDGVWFAVLERAGRPTAEILARLTETIVARFPWPKSMTWGDGKLRWIRPLHSLVCVFDRKIVPAEIPGVRIGDISEGHRFMGPRRPFRARDFDEYREALAGHFVVLGAPERKRRILEKARPLCAARGLELVEDAGLLDEVAGMVEWPVPILGDMDPRFLALPPEVVRTSMRVHQRYFAVRRAGDGALAPHFVCVANIETRDGGALIAAGNARVLSARLDDARFFWDEDRKVPLEARLETLKGVTFHARVGTLFERVERIETLARALAPVVGADPDLAARAARLAKADLATGMVGEFPELQGVMGGYYAAAQGEPEAVAQAVRDHYKPQGPSDSVPTAPVTVAVALADKLDSLAGFFAIGEAPTGSRDPFALRRAALGVIRILFENDVRASVGRLAGLADTSGSGQAGAVAAFFADRLKVLLRDQGRRHDLVDAVFALGDDDLVRLAARIEALGAFLSSEDGANLLAGSKRAANILAAEARKGPLPEGGPVRTAAPAEEAALFDALAAQRPLIDAALAREDFAGAMRALASLRAPVDAFFDKVLVNAEEPDVRANRLRLLAAVQREMSKIADFSAISG